MITQLLLGEIVAILTTVFSFFPAVDKLPIIPGLNIDLDSLIVGGISDFMRVSDLFWFMQDVLWGFKWFVSYLALKLVIRAIGNALSRWGGASLS